MNPLTTSLILVVVLIITWYFLYKKKIQDLPPGPWNLPILGSLLWLDAQNPHLSLTKFSKKYGPVFGLQLGQVYTVAVSDAKLLKKILTKGEAIGETPLYVLRKMLRGKGIFLSQGSRWKEQRKFVVNFLNSAGASKVSPNKKILQAQIMESVDDFVQYVKYQGDRVVLNPSKVLVHNVASVTAILFLGKCWPRDDEFWKRLLHKMEEATELAGFAGPLNFLPFLRFLPQYRKTLNYLVEVYSTIYNMIQVVSEETKKNLEGKHNFISTFLNTKIKSDLVYTEEDFGCLLVDLFGASIETTTDSLLWIILYLAKYRQIQMKIRQELIDVLQGKAPTIDDLPNLPLLEATIAEVARIRTVVPLGLPHSALEDLQMEGFRIPKGAMIMPLLWGIHMDPKIWDQPEKFNPERFLDNDGLFFKPESFIPFLDGKRRCPGEELTKIVIFSFASNILLNFEISSEREVNLDGVCGITLAPKAQNLVFIKI